MSVLDFHQMAEAGILDEDDRVELIEGELFDMAPAGSKHAGIVDLLVERLTLGAKGRALVRGQGPLQIPLHNEPLPDALLLKSRADRYRHALPLPEDVLLAIEVTDSTVARDRDLKIPIYGRHGIPEAWLNARESGNSQGRVLSIPAARMEPRPSPARVLDACSAPWPRSAAACPRSAEPRRGCGHMTSLFSVVTLRLSADASARR